jgi:hypothetical protein
MKGIKGIKPLNQQQKIFIVLNKNSAFDFAVIPCIPCIPVKLPFRCKSLPKNIKPHMRQFFNIYLLNEG